MHPLHFFFAFIVQISDSSPCQFIADKKVDFVKTSEIKDKKKINF